jgi:hypothetical protein
MSRSKQPLWCFTVREEYPPESRLVWTTDGEQVLKGRYAHPDILGGAPLEEGAWTNQQGEPIAVKAWLPVEESPDSPPEPPLSFPNHKPEWRIRLHDHEPYPWAGTIWTRYKTGDTTPPTGGEPHWTFDGETVRKGIWHMFEPVKWDAEGWPEGEWRGMDGQIITVTHWLDITNDGEITPAPPFD